jgi:hypothetical protein
VRGCHEKAKHGYVFNDEVFDRCPLKLIKPQTFALLHLYSHCENFKTLPFSGSLAVQPAKIMIAFSWISKQRAERQQEEYEKMRRKQKRR